jgi:hypothetical protein
MIHRDKPKRLRSAAIAAAIVVLAGGGIALLPEPQPALKGVPLGRIKEHSPMIDPSAPVVTQAPAATPATAQAPTPGASPRAGPPPLNPLDPTFDKLVASADYKDHRKAYDMALVCMRENGPYGVRLVAKPCELSQGKWMDAEVRKRLITECAEAGDCWTEMWNEGPTGHYPVFTAAEFEPLQKVALQKAVEKRDPFALRYEANALRDLAQKQAPAEARATLTKALSYEIASSMGVAYLNGQPFDPSVDPGLQRKLALPAYQTLSPTETKEATDEARRLVAEFKKAKESTS